MQIDPLAYISGKIPQTFFIILLTIIVLTGAGYIVYRDNKDKFGKKANVIGTLVIIIYLIVIPILFYFVNSGYTKEFKVTVNDKYNEVLYPSTVYLDVPSKVFPIHDKTPAVVELNNHNLPVYLKAEHKALTASKEFTILNFASGDSRVAIKMNNSSTKIDYRNKGKGFNIIDKTHVKCDSGGINIFTEPSARESYVLLRPALLQNNQSYEIRTKFILYRDSSSFFIDIGNALRVYVGDPAMKSVIVWTNPTRESEQWVFHDPVQLESQLLFNKNIIVSVAIINRSNTNKLMVTVYNGKQDNKTLEHDLGALSLMPNIKIGAIGNTSSKEKVLRLIDTEIITNSATTTEKAS